jgi:lipopolysaccharide transport system permease protein
VSTGAEQTYRRTSLELLLTLVQRQVLLRSKRALIGSVWPAVAPLVMLALYSFVFNRVFSVPVPRYPEFLFAGLVPWVFLSQSISASISSLSAEADLVRRAPFRYELVPIAMVLSMAVYLLVTLVGFCAFLAIHGRFAWELAPVLLVPTASVVLFAAGIGQIVALFDVYNRDLRWVVGNLLTVWFFMLPIVYRSDMVPDALSFLESTDPMNMIVGQFRSILYLQEVSRPAHLILMSVVCVLFFLGSRWVFRRLGTDLPKDI